MKARLWRGGQDNEFSVGRCRGEAEQARKQEFSDEATSAKHRAKSRKTTTRIIQFIKSPAQFASDCSFLNLHVNWT